MKDVLAGNTEGRCIFFSRHPYNLQVVLAGMCFLGGVVFHATGFGQHSHQWINFEIFRQYPYRVKKLLSYFIPVQTRKLWL